MIIFIATCLVCHYYKSHRQPRIIISIDVHPSRVALALFYRPPSSYVSVFDTLITTLYSSIDVTLFSNFVLLGNFNVNVMNPHHPLFCNIQMLASSLCITQVVSEPTRISQYS